MTTMAAPAVRLPAAPLLAAIAQAQAACGLSLNQLLGSRRKVHWRVRCDGVVAPRVAEGLCAVIGYTPREVYGDDWPQERPPVFRGQSNMRLPAGPLLAAVDDRLGAGACAAIDATHPGRARALQDLLGCNGARAYQRAGSEGTVTLRTIEGFCDRLGWHPRELYGGAYDRAAFAGCPKDYDPWEGVA